MTTGKFDDGGPAVPLIVAVNGSIAGEVGGMTLLDWFAGRAFGEAVHIANTKGVARIKELMAGATVGPDDNIHRSVLIAREAYILAEGMLAEKRRREGGGT